MRKYFTALAILLSLPCTCFAAFAIFQAYTYPQIFYNIVTDGGASCNGNVQNATYTVTSTLNSGTFTITGGNSFDQGGNTSITITGPSAGGGRIIGG